MKKINKNNPLSEDFFQTFNISYFFSEPANIPILGVLVKTHERDNDKNIEKIAMTKPNFPATSKFIDLDIIGT